MDEPRKTEQEYEQELDRFLAAIAADEVGENEAPPWPDEEDDNE